MRNQEVMTIIDDPKKLPLAWSEEHRRLALQFSALLRTRARTIVEFGCGRGQLTVPLARALPHARILGVDRYQGPYMGTRAPMRGVLLRERLRGRVRVVDADVPAWLSLQRESAFAGAISAEFLPELTLSEMRDLFAECHRILGRRGMIVHSFLSPYPRNERQKLVVEADSNPRWTEHPPRAWFSPPAQDAADELQSAGFERVDTHFLRSRLRVRALAAQEILRAWGMKNTFWNAYRDRLTSDGMELPDWVIVTGRKGR